jgi:hypothetical protein
VEREYAWKYDTNVISSFGSFRIPFLASLYTPRPSIRSHGTASLLRLSTVLILLRWLWMIAIHKQFIQRTDLQTPECPAQRDYLSVIAERSSHQLSTTLVHFSRVLISDWMSKNTTVSSSTYQSWDITVLFLELPVLNLFVLNTGVGPKPSMFVTSLTMVLASPNLGVLLTGFG